MTEELEDQIKMLRNEIKALKEAQDKRNRNIQDILDKIESLLNHGAI